MKRARLPLTALRSFEAAGRQLSFTRAAEELHVSQAAVSRQIRELETVLGHALFERRHRQVVLTERGAFLLHLLTASFDRIAGALNEMQASPAETRLPISVEPSFAACWLVPHLDGFRHRHPEIDIAVDSDARLADFRSGTAELAIRWSETVTAWPHVQAIRLAGLAMSPVLAPGLLAPAKPLNSPADLLSYPLLHEEDHAGWHRWFSKAGLKTSPVRGPLFAEMALALQAAILGHGVALVIGLLAERELRKKQLIRPFDIEVPCGAYWLVAPDLSRLSPAAERFVTWLRAEFRQA